MPNLKFAFLSADSKIDCDNMDNGGGVYLIFSKLTSHVSLKPSHHKPMGMYGGGLFTLALGHKWGSWASLSPTVNLRRPPPYITKGLW